MVFLLASLSPCLVRSAEPAETVDYASDYFAVLPGYSMPSKAYGTTGTGVTISGIYGHEVTAHVAVEINVQSSTFETGNAGGTDFYQNGGTVDLSLSPWDRRSQRLVTPFVLLGIGGVYDDFFPNSRDGGAFVADAGLGAATRALFAIAIRFRAEARYVHDGKEGGHGEGRLLAGVEIPLGRRVTRTVYLPGKTEIHEVLREVSRPWVDSDGDGVDDDHDRCPNTPHGLKVDATGCVIEAQTIALQGVTFDNNSSRLTPNAMVVLDLVSRAFLGQNSLRVEIDGHTDSVGSAVSNLHLSETRAESVRTYLIFKGVRPEQLSARGFGKSRLLIDPETGAQDRERNRRVELRVLAP